MMDPGRRGEAAAGAANRTETEKINAIIADNLYEVFLITEVPPISK